MKKLLSFILAAVMFTATFAALPASAKVSFSDVESDRWSAA